MTYQPFNKWIALCASALVLASASAHAADDVRWRASGSYPEGHSTTHGAKVFKAETAKLTNNALRVDLFPNNTLGGALEQVDQVRTGQIQLAWGSIGFYDKLVPELGAAILPFAATSPQQAICQMESGLGKFLEDKMAEKGVLVLGWAQVGARHVTNNKRPIKSVADMDGLKIRTLPGEAWLLTFRALGANPTPIDIKELYQAMQQGVVDGQENPYDNMVVRKFPEVQKYLSNSGHFYDWAAYMVNKASFEKLTPEQQEAVRQAAKTATEEQRAMSMRENEVARGQLVKAGMEYHELSPADLAKFREATHSVYVEMRKKLGDEAMDLVEQGIEKCANT
ncbi:TRAP transporter substrate-binding protein [Alcaligenaceae bacterium]|nr:TRAP transporter substrate-binding protein [Alcaligenaceae bacterium]